MASVNAGKVDPTLANALAVAYLGTRAVYNVVYVVLQGYDARWALVRSGVWFSGVGVIMAMFCVAGAAVY